jgi:hypothetical protein
MKKIFALWVMTAVLGLPGVTYAAMSAADVVNLIKRRKVAMLFGLVLAVWALSIGSALAYTVEAPIGHNTIAYLVNGKTDYAPTAPGAASPKYGYTYIEFYPKDGNPIGDTGSVIVKTKTPTAVEDWYGVPKGSFTDAKEFSPVWSADYVGYYLADADGSEIRFADGAETGFSEGEIEVSIGSIQETVKLPLINTTARQMNDKCVPYIELIMEGENVTGASWRFVDPARPSIALTRKAGKGGDINRVSYVKLYSSPYEELAAASIRKEWAVGETLSGTVTFDKAVPLDRVVYARFSFQFDDGYVSNPQQVNPYSFYSWHFYPVTVKKNSGGGGGCSTGVAFGFIPLALLALGRLVPKKKR